MSGEAEPSEDDIITQLQGQVVLLTSQFYNYAGYIQKEAPPQGEPLSVEGNGPTPPVGDFLEIFSQCVSETISTTQNICKLIDSLPEPRDRKELENEFQRLATEADQLDVALREELESSDELLQHIRESLRSVTKDLLR